MASNVIAQLSGGSKQVLENVDTVGDVKEQLNAQDGYTVAVNGSPADDDKELREGDFVSLSKAVKGG